MDKLYYISQPDHLQNIQNVCEAGVKLVQLRTKNENSELVMKLALEAQAICGKYGATFIINDQVEITKAIQADGVHLGTEDMCPLKAREILGSNFLIGGTANTYQDCMDLIAKKVDYIGLGPFQFTETKKKLSPVLGITGYITILQKLKQNGHMLPVYAIGGIALPEAKELQTTDIHGIAVSGLLSNTTLPNISQVLAHCDFFKN